MPTITNNQLKGNYAAAYVAARLSASCLVRPVAADTDVGVDLYCETIEEGGYPFLHFWVQVKSGDQCRVAADGATATCSFHRDHLEYWRRQPVPVFAALVPVEWPVDRDPHVYVANITEVALFEALPARSRSVSSSQVWRAGDRDSIHRFLKHDVSAADAQLQCRRGVVAATPSLAPKYVNATPRVRVEPFQDEVLWQIRRTAALAILNLDPLDAIGTSQFRRICANVLRQFSDDGHWETFAARAQSLQCDGEFAEAMLLYDKAIESIEGDSNLVPDDWAQQLSDLKAKRARCAAAWPVEPDCLA